MEQEQQAGDTKRPPTKMAVIVAGVAIGLALLVVMLAPGGGNDSATTPTASSTPGALTGSPNSAADDAAADAKVAGTAAPLSFTMKDMNGVDVKLSEIGRAHV